MVLAKLMPDTVDDLIGEINPMILHLMRRGSLILSGSTAMYYFMKSRDLIPGFIPGDVDFHVKDTDKDYTNRCLKILQGPDGFQERTSGSFSRFYERKQNGDRKDEIITRVWSTYRESGKKIDLIILSENYQGTTVDFVETYFDLDICKCWYDGNELHGPYELLRDRKCKLTKIPAMELRRGRYRPVQLLEYCHSIKTFNPLVDRVRPVNDFFKTRERILRYTRRGFTIDTSEFEVPQYLIDTVLLPYVPQSRQQVKEEGSFWKKLLTAVIISISLLWILYNMNIKITWEHYDD